MKSDYTGWGADLRQHFDLSLHGAPVDEWDSVKVSHSVGEEVVGTVITKAPFGAWIDIGVGFPCLLEIPEIDGLDRDSYDSDTWCPVGTRIFAAITTFRDDNKQIYLTQKNHSI